MNQGNHILVLFYESQLKIYKKIIKPNFLVILQAHF
jgi:hypothetical protein